LFIQWVGSSKESTQKSKVKKYSHYDFQAGEIVYLKKNDFKLRWSFFAFQTHILVKIIH
jgi:hypothetical protein